VSSKKNTYIKYNTLNTKLIRAHRTLCECELYAPSNYENDPEMKEVMQDFDRQISQRLEEYNKGVIKNRQKCKEKCDKEVQKIILKDKIEKELAEKFVTLQTDISINDLPTCVCEKSVVDKVEKTCSKCAGVLGGGITPGWGLISGIVYTGWKAAALAAATKEAIAEGAAKGLLEGIEAGKNAVIGGLQKHFFIKELGIGQLDSYFTKGYYFDIENLAKAIYDQRNAICGISSTLGDATCNKIGISIGTMLPNGKPAAPGTGPIVQRLNGLAYKAKLTADDVTKTTTEKVTAELTTKQTTAINATYASYEITIIASIVAIVIIVLIMVIIYLILRYRRKKKMKKKLQYIKLLEE
ncbi:hypothetical protein PFAG_06116, partial [Plasmodium falciparum Santa Lucia]